MPLSDESEADSGSQAPAAAGDVGLDFTLDDPAEGDDLARTATTRQMTQPDFANDESTPTQRMAIDGPTVEQPTLQMGDALTVKIDAQGNGQGSGGSDQTAELAIDDLGLDLGSLEGTGSNLLDDSRLVRALEAGDEPEASSSDAPTLVAGMDETSRRLIEESAGSNQATELLPISDDFDSDGGMTSRVPSLDLELDVDPNAETGTQRTMTSTGSGTDFSLDLDVGSPEQPEDGEYQRTQRIEPEPMADPDMTETDLEPVTMSEVGTKLDLARAYMDMGDPDGARSILNEVLQEGSASQCQEAQRLLDSIPG
jgi:pilus assembly protein FimV